MSAIERKVNWHFFIGMVRLNYPFSFNGDSWLNSCFLLPDYEYVMGPVINHLLRWTEPYILVTCCLVILLLLPLIFLIRPEDAYMKVSRLYNVSRLSVLTFFHRLSYIYVIISPLSFLIGQNPPCRALYISHESSFERIYYLPNPRFSAFCLLMLYLWSISSATRKKFSWGFLIVMLVMGGHYVMTGDMSVGQWMLTTCLSYALHFYAMRVPFWFLHIENILIAVIFIIMFAVERGRYWEDTEGLGRTVAALSLWIADFLLLGRYHCTRAGFVAIGRPIDMEWETDSKSSAYFSILSSEGEDAFTANLRMDLVDSIIAVVVYAFGLLFRQLVGGSIRSSSSGFI